MIAHSVSLSAPDRVCADLSEASALVKAGALRQFPVQAFGAKGDGLHDDTTAIQAAIDTCTQAGGVESS